MIIGPKFIIGHIGKTAGDGVKQIVETLGLPDLTIIPVASPLKHQTFRQCGCDLAGRDLVLAIRRLPAFVLSQLHHRRLDGRLQQLPTPDEMSRDYMADFYIRLYTDEGRLAIKHWLRTESIREDLAALLSRYFELTEEQRQYIEGTATKPANAYDHDVFDRFTRQQLGEMYARNPRWAEIERQVYGNLMTDPAARAA